MRKSLRLQAVGDPSSAMSKAKKRVKNKAAGNRSSSGIPLMNTFPYHRLSLEQVKNLFSIYQIQLGHNADEAAHIIHKIQHQERASFEEIILSLLDQTKSLDPSQKVILDESNLNCRNLEMVSQDDIETFHDSISILEDSDVTDVSNTIGIGGVLVSS